MKSPRSGRSSSSYAPAPPSSIITSGRRKTHGGGSGPGGMRTNLLQMIKKNSSSISASASARGTSNTSSRFRNNSNLVDPRSSPRGAVDHSHHHPGDHKNNNGEDDDENEEENGLIDENSNSVSSHSGGALSGLHLSVRYILPRVTLNSSFSGTIAAMHGYAQPSHSQASRDQSALYTCFARREPNTGVNNRTEVICAGTTTGSVVLWRYRLSSRLHGLPPPANTIPPALVLGSHRATVTSMAFYDDAVLVTGSNDCTLRLWDVHLQYISTEAPGFKAGSRCIQTVVAHESTISAVSVHGPWIVSAGSKDGTVKIWGCAPGREKLSFPFLVPLQVIVLESRITAMHCGELRAVEGVVPDLVIATADGNLTMFRSTEEALVATSTGSSNKKESIDVFRLAKQIRTHYPDGTIPSLLNNNNIKTEESSSSTSADNTNTGSGDYSSGKNIINSSNNQNNNNNNNNNNQHPGGSITSIVPLSELNTVISIGYASACFARDSLNFSIMNALNHPDVMSSMSNPGNSVRFVHCAYDSKKEELLLIDSLGEVFIWSTKSARIVFRTTKVVGAFYAIAVGERGFWVAGKRDIYLIRIEREEHRLEHPIHRERIVFVSLAPSREWWSLGGSSSRASLPLVSTTTTTTNNNTNNYISDHRDMIGQQQLTDITPWLVTASVDNTVKIWNANMKCMHSLKEKRSELSSFSILQTQPGFVVSGHEDGCIKVWAVTAHASSTLRMQATAPTHNMNNNNNYNSSHNNSAASSFLPQLVNPNANSVNLNNNNNGSSSNNPSSSTNGNNSSNLQYVSASEAFSQDAPSNAFHFSAHTNTVSVIGEGLHRHNPFYNNSNNQNLASSSYPTTSSQQQQQKYEYHPHLFSTSYDGTLAVWLMPTLSGSKVKCEARVKCSDSEIVSAVYDPVQYCYWVGTNRGEVTAWSIDELKPIRKLFSSSSLGNNNSYPTTSRLYNNNNNNNAAPFFTLDQSATLEASAIHHHQLFPKTNNSNNNNQRNNHHNNFTNAHTEAVTSISLDANYVFTGSEDGTIKMWNGVTGELHHKNGFEYDEEGIKILKELLKSSSSSNGMGGRNNYDDDDDDGSDSDSEENNDVDNHGKNNNNGYGSPSSIFESKDDDDVGGNNNNNNVNRNTNFEDFLKKHNHDPSFFEEEDNNKNNTSKTNNKKNKSRRSKKKPKRNRGIKMAGDVHHMFLLEETGQIVVGTRKGVVSIFDQATGKAVAIGTTNKAHVTNVQMPVGGESITTSSSSSTLSSRSTSHHHHHPAPPNKNNNNNNNHHHSITATTQHKNQTKKLIDARRLMHAKFLAQQSEFKLKIAREVSCVTISKNTAASSSKTSHHYNNTNNENDEDDGTNNDDHHQNEIMKTGELVAGLGNGSIVRLAMHALRKVPKKRRQDVDDGHFIIKDVDDNNNNNQYADFAQFHFGGAEEKQHENDDEEDYYQDDEQTANF